MVNTEERIYATWLGAQLPRDRYLLGHLDDQRPSYLQYCKSRECLITEPPAHGHSENFHIHDSALRLAAAEPVSRLMTV